MIRIELVAVWLSAFANQQCIERRLLRDRGGPPAPPDETIRRDRSRNRECARMVSEPFDC